MSARAPIGIPLPASTRFGREWRNYEKLGPHKALAVAGDPHGRYVSGYAFGRSSKGSSIEMALEACESRRRDRRIEEPCRLYAVGDHVLSRGEEARSLDEEGTLRVRR